MSRWPRSPDGSCAMPARRGQCPQTLAHHAPGNAGSTSGSGLPPPGPRNGTNSTGVVDAIKSLEMKSFRFLARRKAGIPSTPSPPFAFPARPMAVRNLEKSQIDALIKPQLCTLHNYGKMKKKSDANVPCAPDEVFRNLAEGGADAVGGKIVKRMVWTRQRISGEWMDGGHTRRRVKLTASTLPVEAQGLNEDLPEDDSGALEILVGGQSRWVD